MIQPQSIPHATGLLLNWQVILATTRVCWMRFASNTIQLIRSPIYPLVALLGYKIVYDISGQTTVPQAQVLGFLITGLLAISAWQATVWGAGIALQSEMWSGTIGTILMSPGSTTSVILGYTLGNFLFFIPATAVTVIAGQLMGANWDASHPLAILIAIASIYGSCICVGLCFAGLFILSRQANAMANFLQEPIHLLGGFYVSREVFPNWLQQFSNILPLAHALDALRAAALEGKSLTGIAEPLIWTGITSFAFALVGVWSLVRLDRAVRRAGTLDLL